jgi:hypothetical protein
MQQDFGIDLHTRFATVFGLLAWLLGRHGLSFEVGTVLAPRSRLEVADILATAWI